MRSRRRARQCLALCAAWAAVVVGACDRSPTGGPDFDLAALEALDPGAGPNRPMISEFIALATRLQASDPGVPDVVLPTLAGLFEGAAAAEAELRGAAAAADLRTGLARLRDSAWSRIDAGATGEGDRLLEEARNWQAASAARVLGRPTSTAYVFLIGRTVERVRSELILRERQGADVRRLLRMVASARELQSDARAALGRGEVGLALDVGAHAADLVNSLIRELRAR